MQDNNQATNGQSSHIISLYVSNKPGVLNRMTLVFSRRGWNIDSLTVSEGHDGRFSHCTITAKGERDGLHRIIAQLDKLVDVIHAEEHKPDQVLSRELALMKIGANGHTTGDIAMAVQAFHAHLLDVTDRTVTFEFRGTTTEIDEIHHKLSEKFSVLELVRTGTIAITKGRAET